MVSRLIVALCILLFLGAVVGYFWGLWMLVYPQMWLLRFMHDFIGDWGRAILAAALVRYGVAWVILRAGQVSPKVKLLRAEADEIKKRYASDKQAENRALMALYQQYGVTGWTFGRPLLVMPVVAWTMVGFVVAMWKTKELHGAAFLWIPDLSARDPIFVLPIVHAVLTAISMRIRLDWTAKTRSAAMVGSAFIWVVTCLVPACWLLAWLVDVTMTAVLRGIRLIIGRKSADSAAEAPDSDA